ncbi:MAG: redoxin domain-containing protein [Patescibacteria group bacterium]
MKKKKQNCSLCEISQDTIERLKIESNKIDSQKPNRKKRIFLKNPKIWLLIIVVILAGLAFYMFSLNFSSNNEKTENNQKPEIRSSAPDFISEDVYGNKIALSDFKNEKPVLLVFWATWCGYCTIELPDLKIFTAKHKNEIQVIAIASGESQETVKNYIEEKDINFLILLDERREIWSSYLARGTPSHFLINKNGKIVTLRPGLASIDDLEVMLTMLEK